MNKKALAMAGGCTALLVLCAICVAGMVVLNIPSKIDQALSSVEIIPPGVQAIATVAPTFSPQSTQPASTRAPSVTQAAGIPASGRTKGNPNAPIAFVDYSDFQ